MLGSGAAAAAVAADEAVEAAVSEELSGPAVDQAFFTP